MNNAIVASIVVSK